MKQAWGENVTVAITGHVAVVTFDRPANNHVSVDMMRDLADCLEAVDAGRQARAIVLQAAGKNFCAGADFTTPGDSVAGGMGGISELYNQAVRLFSIETTIVAAVQGAAVGAGLGLAMVADFRVASPDAKFAANFVKLGFHPGFGLTHTLPRVIGAHRASLMFLSGRRVKADEGKPWGLVDEVVPLEDLREGALRLAAEIADNAPLALLATRRTMRGELAAAVRARPRHEHIQQTAMRATDDFADGVKSVAERRSGDFAWR